MLMKFAIRGEERIGGTAIETDLRQRGTAPSGSGGEGKQIERASLRTWAMDAPQHGPVLGSDGHPPVIQMPAPETETP